MGEVVAMAGVVKTFGATRALDGLDLLVRRGEVHGLLGPGLAYGSLVVATGDLVADNPEILEMIPGGARDVVAGAALLVAAAAAATGVTTPVLGDVLLAVVVLLPASWVLVGLAVALWGADARLGPWAWLGVAWSAVVFVLGVSLDLPGWARWPSPFAHVADVPLEGATPWPSLVLLALAAALVAAGLLLWRRRDVRTG